MTFEACLLSPVSLVNLHNYLQGSGGLAEKILSFKKKYSCIYEFPRETLYVFYVVSTRHPSMSGRCYLHT